MKYAKLIDKLYNGSLEDVLYVLNKTIYVTDLEPMPENSFIIHTGFTFRIQHKEMVLLYELETEKIIRQVYIGLTTKPRRVNGLIMAPLRNGYLNDSTNSLIVKISDNDNFNLGILYLNKEKIVSFLTSDKITEINCIYEDEEVLVSSFKITDGKNTIQNIPLSKELNHRFYFDGSMFHLDQDSRNKFDVIEGED